MPGGAETATVDGGELPTGKVDARAVVAGSSDWSVVEAGVLDGDELHANDTNNGKTRNKRMIQVVDDEVRMPPIPSLG